MVLVMVGQAVDKYFLMVSYAPSSPSAKRVCHLSLMLPQSVCLYELLLVSVLLRFFVVRHP